MAIDGGPDPDVTPRMLDILGQYGTRVTFFCIGELTRRHPHCIEAAVACGYVVENHSQRRRHTLSLKRSDALRRGIAATQDTLTQIADTHLLFFRTSAGLRNPFLGPVLCQLGLQLASWTHCGFNTRLRNPEVVTQHLLHGLVPQDILLLHGGHAAHDTHSDPILLIVLPKMLETTARAQLQCTMLRVALAPGPTQAMRS